MKPLKDRRDQLPVVIFDVRDVEVLVFSEFTLKDGKMFVCDRRDRAITCVFGRDLHLTLMFSSLLQKDLFKRK